MEMVLVAVGNNFIDGPEVGLDQRIEQADIRRKKDA